MEGYLNTQRFYILVEPENSIIKQYTDLIELDGVKLNFTEEAISFVAGEAFKNKTGARGLKTILEKTMTDLMFTLPDEENVTEIIMKMEHMI